MSMVPVHDLVENITQTEPKLIQAPTKRNIVTSKGKKTIFWPPTSDFLANSDRREKLRILKMAKLTQIDATDLNVKKTAKFKNAESNLNLTEGVGLENTC